MRAAMLLVCLLFWRAPATAQLGLLTLREAEGVVEHLPDVRAAQSDVCPFLSAGYDEVGYVFQVRGRCGPAKGALIGSYRVNRRTGAVTTLGDSPVVVGDRETRDYSDRIVSRARARALTGDEARCLAKEAAKSLPGWVAAGSSISVDSSTGPGRDQARFTVWHRSSIRPADSGRTLDVEMGTGRVRDYETGEYLMSADLGALTSEILNLRQPPWLSDEDSLSLALALKLPAFAEGIRRGCRLYAAGPFRSDETEVGLSCAGAVSVGAPVLAVNIETGGTTDAETGERLESDEATRLAQTLLEAVKAAEVENRRLVAAACSGE